MKYGKHKLNIQITPKKNSKSNFFTTIKTGDFNVPRIIRSEAIWKGIQILKTPHLKSKIFVLNNQKH